MRSEIDLLSSLAQQLLRWLVAKGKELPGERLNVLNSINCANSFTEALRLSVGQMYNADWSKPSLGEIRVDLLTPLISLFPKCAIIIDGIDNCTTESDFTSSLLPYLRRLGHMVVLKVLVSTRTDWLLPSDASILTLDSHIPDSHAHQGDIMLYVDKKLDDLSGPDELLEDPDLRKQVRDELLAKAEGMYVSPDREGSDFFG